MFWHWQVDTWTGELAKTVNRFVYRRDIVVRITKLKDKTGMRNRNKGTFKRDEWTYKKCKEYNGLAALNFKPALFIVRLCDAKADRTATATLLSV